MRCRRARTPHVATQLAPRREYPPRRRLRGRKLLLVQQQRRGDDADAAECAQDDGAGGGGRRRRVEEEPVALSRRGTGVRIGMRRRGRAFDGCIRQRGHSTGGRDPRIRREEFTKNKFGPGEMAGRKRRRGGMGDGSQPRGWIRVQAVQSRRRRERGVLSERTPRVLRLRLGYPVPERHPRRRPSSRDRRRYHPRGLAVGQGRHTHLPHMRARTTCAARPCPRSQVSITAARGTSR